MKVYITLLSNKNYLQGVLVLHRSLKASESDTPFIVPYLFPLIKKQNIFWKERAFGAFVSCILP